MKYHVYDGSMPLLGCWSARVAARTAELFARLDPGAEVTVRIEGLCSPIQIAGGTCTKMLERTLRSYATAAQPRASERPALRLVR